MRFPGSRKAADQPAFADLVREHSDAVFGFVLRRVRDRDRAEDLSQETFMRAWRGLSSFRGSSSPRAWLYAIAANAIRDDARRRSRRPVEVPITDEDVPGSDDPARRAEAADALGRLRSALERLPENHREMFLLRERDGLSYAEIARVLNCPVGSVMSGLARARARLLEAVEG